MACDDESKCSSWIAFNTSSPNFKVDVTAPAIPGDLTIIAKNSSSITLDFGAESSDTNFSNYKIFYSTSTPATINDIEHNDSDLNTANYGGTSDTVVSGLASSTLYYLNIWAFDLAGNMATAIVQVSTTTSASANLIQTSYLFENDNGSDVDSNTSPVSADTTINNLEIGERLSVRIQFENNGGDIANNKVYKFQFENQTDAPGVWVDIGASSEISYSSGLAGSNGNPITSDKASANSNTWMDGGWYSDTNLSDSLSLNYDYYTELVSMIETSNALAGKTYRLRIYNNTDNTELNTYSIYPTFSIIASSIERFSKDGVASLSSGTDDLTYFLDPKGYSDLGTDDASRDGINSTANIPVFNFIVKHTNDTDAMSISWNGQSSMAASTSAISLQIYKYGSPNEWITIASSTAATINTDLNLNANLNASLSSYYDGSNWTSFRVYQESGTQNLKSDYFNVTYSAPVPDIEQLHYRWRDDDGTQITANWRELEDEGDPTGATNPIEIGEKIRLRLEVANLGAGAANNYTYNLEYASTSNNCSTGVGSWNSVTTNGSGHFDMATTTNFNNGDPTTAQLANSELYTFTAGSIVKDPNVLSSSITLNENRYTEVEYLIEATSNSVVAGTYCFRLTNNSNVLDDYIKYPILTMGGSTNNIPAFASDGLPSDGGSASTSPTSFGDDITFTGTGGDADGDDYYLAICKTDSASAGNDGPPSCTGGNWCISDSTASSTEASCTYATDDNQESLAWYAFVCDKQPGFNIAKCSASSQGPGNSLNDSPFVINHPPAFTSVATEIENQDPGSTFKFETVSSETDIVGGEDTASLYICLVDNASSAGCAGVASNTVCSVIASTSDNLYCTYSDIAPTPATTTTYYAFMYDSHGLAATTNSLSDTYTINNVLPVLGTTVLNGGSKIDLNLKGASDTVVNVVNASIVDQNGCDSGIVSASAVIYMTGATNGVNCTDNDNDCYQLVPLNCTKNDCVDDNDPTASYTCSAGLAYFAVPTDPAEGNPNETHTWVGRIQVYDGANYVSESSVGVELITGPALNVPESLIDFGSGMFPGDDTGTTNSTTTIENAGNSPIDTDIAGTNMEGDTGDIITVNYIEWSLVDGFDYSTGNPLSLGGEPASIDISRPTTASGTTGMMYWGIEVPFGVDASIYNGENTFTVIFNETGW